MPEEVVLAFDIGIRNLAWCLMEGGTACSSGDDSGPKAKVLGWQNYDLLAGRGHEEASAKVKAKCYRCTASASFWNTEDGAEKPTCLRHCPVSRPPLKDLSGSTVLKKIPPVGTLRDLVGRFATVKKTTTKAVLLGLLEARYSLPLEKLKVKKAVEHDLALIHDAIRGLVRDNLSVFAKATRILLENQPVLKNPTMKTVQILLFATLRDFMQPVPPPLKLVHASKKNKGSTKEGGELAKGDAGYKARKDASEEKALGILEGGKVEQGVKWSAHLKAQAKKSDLADAFCMCWDALSC